LNTLALLLVGARSCCLNPTSDTKQFCCIWCGPCGECVVDVVPGGMELKPQFKMELGRLLALIIILMSSVQKFIICEGCELQEGEDSGARRRTLLADQCISTGQNHKRECVLSLREIYMKSRVASVQSPPGLDPCATRNCPT
jgi:hypothetical protein